MVLGLLLRLGLIISLAEMGYSLISILSIGFASGKIAIIFSRNLFSHSKFAKTGTIVKKISNKNLIIAILIWIVPTLFILPLDGILLGIILMLSIIFIVGLKSKNALGGITGDILGAIAFSNGINVSIWKYCS